MTVVAPAEAARPSSLCDEARHDETQARRWSRSDARHYAWQTTGPYFAATEADLLSVVRPRGRLLEVGCGEGGNLFHLEGAREGATLRFGVDRFPEKVAFLRARQPDVRAAACDAAALPFRAGAFDTVLVRDLLHHVFDRARVLAEAWRVLAPLGALVVIEPNARSPLILAQGLAVKAERGALRSTPGRLRAELEALPGRGEVVLDMAQPWPVERVVLHPDLGRPGLGARRVARALLAAKERLARAVVPRAVWTYVRARVEKR